MQRLLQMLLLGALGCAAVVAGFAAVGFAASPGTSAATSWFGASALGVACGLVLAWMRAVPVPLATALVRRWHAGVAGQIWWLAAGAVSLAVLAFY